MYCAHHCENIKKLLKQNISFALSFCGALIARERIKNLIQQSEKHCKKLGNGFRKIIEFLRLIQHLFFGHTVTCMKIKETL